MAKNSERKIPISKAKELAKKEALQIIEENKVRTVTTIIYASILSFADLYKTNQRKKIQEFVSKIKSNLVNLSDGTISVNDLEEVLKEEYELNISEIFKL